MRTNFKLITLILSLLVVGALSAQNTPETVSEDHLSVMANLRPYFSHGGAENPIS